jgi:hypothetical protein
LVPQPPRLRPRACGLAFFSRRRPPGGPEPPSSPGSRWGGPGRAHPPERSPRSRPGPTAGAAAKCCSSCRSCRQVAPRAVGAGHPGYRVHEPPVVGPRAPRREPVPDPRPIGPTDRMSPHCITLRTVGEMDANEGFCPHNLVFRHRRVDL